MPRSQLLKDLSATHHFPKQSQGMERLFPQPTESLVLLTTLPTSWESTDLSPTPRPPPLLPMLLFPTSPQETKQKETKKSPKQTTASSFLYCHPSSWINGIQRANYKLIFQQIILLLWYSAENKNKFCILHKGHVEFSVLIFVALPFAF